MYTMLAPGRPRQTELADWVWVAFTAHDSEVSWTDSVFLFFLIEYGAQVLEEHGAKHGVGAGQGEVLLQRWAEEGRYLRDVWS